MLPSTGRGQVLQTIDERESRLTEVKQALRSFQWHRGRDMDADSLLAALMGLRDTSLRVVRAIMVRCEIRFLANIFDKGVGIMLIEGAEVWRRL